MNQHVALKPSAGGQRLGRAAAWLAAGPLALSIAAGAPAQADIIRVEDMVRGITMTQAQCAAIAQAVWVKVAGRDYCMRYYLSKDGGSTPRATLFLQGDQLGIWDSTGKYKLDPERAKDINTDSLASDANSISHYTKTTGIYLGRPGVDGSSGDHRHRHSDVELNVTNAALDAIKKRHGLEGFHLIGQSGGATLVGGLLALRDDIGCAAIGAGRLSLPDPGPRRRWMIWGGLKPLNIVDMIPEIAKRRGARIMVVTDPADAVVPEAQQTEFVKKLRAAGVRVKQYMVNAPDEKHHGVVNHAIAATDECIRGATQEQITAKLQDLLKRRDRAPPRLLSDLFTATVSGGPTEAPAGPPKRPIGDLFAPKKPATPAPTPVEVRREPTPPPKPKSLESLFGPR